MLIDVAVEIFDEYDEPCDILWQKKIFKFLSRLLA